jgi:hypothetical protein
MPLDTRLYRSPEGELARLTVDRVAGPGREQWWSVSLVRANGNMAPVAAQPFTRRLGAARCAASGEHGILKGYPSPAARHPLAKPGRRGRAFSSTRAAVSSLRDASDALAGATRAVKQTLKPDKVTVQAVSQNDVLSFGFTTGISPLGSLHRRKKLEVVVDGVSYDLHSVMREAYLYWLGKVLPYHIAYSIPKSDRDVQVSNQLTE